MYSEFRLKEIVYQWARIRFGVFDESPQGTEPNVYPVDGGNAFEGSRCSLQIPGRKIQSNVVIARSDLSLYYTSTVRTCIRL